MTLDVLFRITDLEVISVSSSRDGAHEPHVNWFVDYAPQKEDELDARVIMATLHVAGSVGRGDIQVGALLWEGSGATQNDESFAAAFAESDALEMLYDFARVSLRSVLAIVESDAEAPGQSPRPEIGQLSRVDDAESVV